MNLKSTRRSGWVEKLGLASSESVAEHCYATTFMATVYADMLGLDAEKIARMSLLHDLAESITGDITPDSIPQTKKESMENDAMNSILCLFPQKVRQKYADAWTEYCNAASDESLMLHQVDKLEMALQAKIYAKQGYHNVDTFLDTARNSVNTPELVNMLDA